LKISLIGDFEKKFFEKFSSKNAKVRFFAHPVLSLEKFNHFSALYKSLTSAGLLRSEYLSDAFAASRASFILVLSNLISNIDRGIKYSLNFSPNVDSPLSVPSGNFTFGPSRYYQDFDEIECIGNGGFGEVFKVSLNCGKFLKCGFLGALKNR
jgi:hypothetical protein